MNVNRLQDRFRSMPPRRRKWFIGTAIVIVVYTLVGFLILPPIVKAVATKRLSALFDRKVTIQKIRLNPYTLSSSIRGLLIQDQDGQPLVSWDEAYANFQLVSFFGKAWVFKEVRLAKPFGRIQFNKDRSLNFSDLTQKFSRAAPEPKEPGKPLFLHIARLQVTGASASFTDLTPNTPFQRLLGPLEITVTKFKTEPSSRNPYAFSGSTDAGEEFSWEGYFSLDPLRSEGNLSFTGFALSKYAPLYQDLVRFEIKDGVAALRSLYQFNIGPTNYLVAVSNAMFSLTSLKIAEKGATNNMVELDKLIIDGVTANAMERRGEITSFFAEGGRLTLTRNRDAQINVVELARPAEDATNAAGSVIRLLEATRSAFAFLLESTNHASGALHRLDITNCAVVWEDSANRRPVHVPVDQINIVGREWSNHSTSNMTAAVSLRWNSNGTLRVETTAQLMPASLDLTLALHDVELGPIDPYLEPFANLSIVDSKVDFEGQVRLRTTTNELPDVTFTGDLRVNDFATTDGVMGQDLVQWKSLHFAGMQATLVPWEVAVREVALLDPSANVAVWTNRVMNVAAALRLGETNSAVPVAKPPPPPSAPAAKSGMNKQFGGFLRGMLESGTNSVGSPLGPKLTVASVTISNASVQFSDQSLQPPVNVSLREFNGAITGLSSEERNRAAIHLTGKVDETSSIEVTGKINPLNKMAATQLKVSVKDVDLAPTSPYVGKYGGYQLNHGQLNLDLDYEISERKLVAKNVIMLDQFTLGRKVESEDATELPIRLAVAVLKDRNGIIEIDVPVEGSLDDPEFRLGKMITRTIMNIITKIVTSPFAALGAILGAEAEELSFQEFAPGSAELQAQGVKKLEALAKGMYERPGLSVEIEGSVDATADSEALFLQKMEHEARLAKWKTLRSAEQARVKPEEIELTRENFEDYVKRIYTKTLSTNAVQARTNPGAPALARAPGVSPKPVKAMEHEKGAQRLMTHGETVPRLTLGELQQQLFQLNKPTEDDLRQLANRRAERLKAALMESGKIDAERVSVIGATEAALVLKGSRAYVHLR